jgi:hypothetical protein
VFRVSAVVGHLFGKTLKWVFQQTIVEERVDGMFTPVDLVLLVVAVVFSVSCVAFYVFVLRRGRSEDRRCPGCDFLVNAKDVGRYGYVCPDCKTDWRVHPLKNDDGEEVIDEISDEERDSEKQRSERSRKRLVR